MEWTWCHRWPLQGAILVCYGWGRGDDQFWESGRGAIAGCHCGSGRGVIAGCHCSVLWLGGRVTTNFGGVDVVPLLGANLCFIFSFYIQGHQFHPDTQENNNECCFELLADVTLFSTLH